MGSLQLQKAPGTPESPCWEGDQEQDWELVKQSKGQRKSVGEHTHMCTHTCAHRQQGAIWLQNRKLAPGRSRGYPPFHANTLGILSKKEWAVEKKTHNSKKLLKIEFVVVFEIISI